MKRNVKLYLHDIHESILAIEDYTKTLSEEDFHLNRQVQDAVIRRFEIIGEAVKNIDKRFRGKYPEVQWKKIAGLRDVLIHGYAGVSLKRVWNAPKNDLPDLKHKLLAIMERENVL